MELDSLREIKKFEWSKERWFIAINILALNHKKLMTMSDIARALETQPTNPTYLSTLSYLIDNNAVVEKEIIGRSRLLKINTKILTNVLINTDIYESFIELVRFKNKFFGLYKV